MAGIKGLSWLQLLLLLFNTFAISVTITLPPSSTLIQTMLSDETPSGYAKNGNLTTSPQSNTEYHCFTILLVYPLYRHCEAAIRHLPSPSFPGDFHTGFPFNLFSLPVTIRYHTCKVVVELVNPNDRSEEGIFWWHIVSRALDLNSVCRTPRVSSRFSITTTGGYVLAGSGLGISVTLGYNNMREGIGGNNETVVASSL
ncbi:hypothetical protein ABVK25_010367 [Lepraria finkii]|uniref:Uncharacterized protein n=1 Tax=Lepraria finkii TaxID=1340010 RepID=A0ABR4AUJ3_9LECA